MRCSISLNNGKPYFVDAIGEFVDFAGEEVVRDNGQSTGCDTEGGVDKGLGNTGGQRYGVRRTGQKL